MTVMIEEISASNFKKYFLSLVDRVKSQHSSFIITKRKVPIAKVIPLDVQQNTLEKSHYGFMKGCVKVNDDIVHFDTSSDWEAIHDR